MVYENSTMLLGYRRGHAQFGELDHVHSNKYKLMGKNMGCLN